MSESATTLLRAPEESGGPLPGLDRNAVEVLAASGPPWLGQRRLEAWRVYEETPMPTTKEEEWRYTDLSKTLRLGELRLFPREEREFAPEGAPALLTGAAVVKAALLVVDAVVVVVVIDKVVHVPRPRFVVVGPIHPTAAIDKARARVVLGV